MKTAKIFFVIPKTSPIFATSNKETACPAGGIGRRVGLKHQYLRMCRFDSGAGYESSSIHDRRAFLVLSCIKASVEQSWINQNSEERGELLMKKVNRYS